MPSKDLRAECLKILQEWYGGRNAQKKTESDAFIACAGLKVAELTKKKWPLEPDDYVGVGRRFRSTGPFIQAILARFGEEREYTSEGGRTTGGSIEAAADLIARLASIQAYGAVSGKERVRVAAAMQKWLYEKVVKPALDAEGVKVEIHLDKAPPEIIGDVLEAASKRGVSGAVAQHLVGAKLAIRYPERSIAPYSHTTKDKQLGRQGDFEVEDTVFHVTMSPGEPVVDKCAKNVADGYRAILLVPRGEIDGAQHFIRKSRYPKRIWLMSVEDFVAQNIAEIGAFGKDGLRNGIKALFEVYNQRAKQAGEKPSALLKTPQNL